MLCFVMMLLPTIVSLFQMESRALRYCNTCSMVYAPPRLTFLFAVQLLVDIQHMCRLLTN